MKDILLQRASALAREAVKRFVNEDRRGFFLEGAGAFELLGKARLAAFHPALVIDTTSLDSLLHVTGASAHAKIPSWQIKTIRVSDVLKRCVLVDPPLAAVEKQLRTLSDVRNSILHAGEIPPEDEGPLFVTFLRACAVLVPSTGSNLTTFFGEHAELVQTYLAESAQATKLRVLALVSAAKTRFIERFTALGPGKNAALKAIEATLQPEGYEEVLVPCPACGQTAILTGSTEVTWEAEDFDSGGNPHSAYPVVTLLPRALYCSFCELTLQSRDELIELGLAESVPIEDVDPSDFYDDPAEDY